MEYEPEDIFQEFIAELPKEPSNTKSDTVNNNGIGKVRREGKTLSEYWETAKNEYRKRAERGAPELPTGIAWIDELTDGLHRGELWTISAKSSFGKTSMALNIARNIADKNKSVLFISLEMRGEELVSRLFCEMNRYDHQNLRKGFIVNVSDFQNKDKAFTDFLNAVDFEIVEQGYRFKDIEAIIASYYEGGYPDLICIDFAQLIDTTVAKDERLALQDYIRKLTELAKTKKIAILLVSQLRRLPSGADYNREPGMEDMKGTGALEQLSTVVILIYKVIINGDIRVMVKLAKNRHGPCGEKEMRFIGENFKFEEIPEEVYQERKDLM